VSEAQAPHHVHGRGAGHRAGRCGERGPEREDQPSWIFSAATTALAVVAQGARGTDSERVQNPPRCGGDLRSQGQGAHKKEHIGFKVQVAETVAEAVLAPGTDPQLPHGIVTHRAQRVNEAA